MENRRKIVLAMLLAATLTLTVFFAVERFHEPTLVYGTQWTGLPNPAGVAIGDYNNDGLNEIAIAETNGGVEVYKGTTVIESWFGLNNPWGVAIGDYDGDGLNDIAFSETSASRVTVYKSDGTTIIKRWEYPELYGARDVAIGDYDNDGANEIAIAEYEGNYRVTVLKNDGVTVVKQWTDLSGPSGVTIGDFDNDGLNDIAFAEVNEWPDPLVTVYKSDGVTKIKEWSGLAARFLAIGDYDNDGLNEIAISGPGLEPPKITVYRSDGTTMVKQLSIPGNPLGVAIGDYNDDQLNDIAFANFNLNTVTVYYQTKPGTAITPAESTIVTLRGTLTDSSGYPIMSGSVRVKVKDSLGVQVWQDTFDSCIDNGKYNLPLGTKTALKLIKGRIYNAILEVDAYSATFISADVIFGDNNPAGDLIKFVAG